MISNPTSLHLDAIDRLLSHVRGVFVEKPLAAALEGVEGLLRRIEQSKTVSFVGYNLEFHPAVIAMRNLLAGGELGDPLILQCQVGQWLPDWHPYEDYRSAYYARADLGGGVIRTLSHEIHLAQQLLGNFTSVCGMFPPHESLPLEVDVIADLMSRHASGAVSQIHLDYLQRPTHRCGTIACTAGWIHYDLINPQVTAQSSADKAPAWSGRAVPMTRIKIMWTRWLRSFVTCEKAASVIPTTPGEPLRASPRWLPRWKRQKNAPRGNCRSGSAIFVESSDFTPRKS